MVQRSMTKLEETDVKRFRTAKDEGVKWLGRFGVRPAGMLALALSICLGGILAGGEAVAQENIDVVDKPDTEAPRNEHYHGNREPLLPSPLIKLPAGSIEPRGWLRKQLELQADGFLGNLTEISDFVTPEGNAWRDPDGEGHGGWEELPYWFRGYISLGYLLEDEEIMDEAHEWVEGVLETQREDGYFGPRANLDEAGGNHDMMPNMFIMFALRTYYEYTGDERILDLLSDYFRWQLDIPEDNFFATGFWQMPRNADNMDSVYWLYNITGDEELLELADKVRRTGVSWMDAPDPGAGRHHNVNFSQGFRKPAQSYPQNEDPGYLEQAYTNYDAIYDVYGNVPGGMFAGDEFARPGFTGPRNPIETCGAAEMILSQNILLRVSGDLLWADRLENVVFNTLPATMTADMKGVRYLTSVNHIYSDRQNRAPKIANAGDMMSMHPFSHRCCQHNVSMAWPYYAENIWKATPGNGLAAMSYSASEVTATVGDGAEVTIAQDTEYPFDGGIQLEIETDADEVRFPLYLRVPAWCEQPELEINGVAHDIEEGGRAFLKVDREWSTGDRVELNLPMEVGVERWEKQRNSASVNYGPLSFSVEIGEDYVTFGGTDEWPAREIEPTTPWNYGLVLDGEDPAAHFEVEKQPWPEDNMVFTHEGAPVRVQARAKRIPNWTDIGMGFPGRLQQSPVLSDEPEETITLIPMGAGRLRIASFPVIGDEPDAREWEAPPPLPASYWPDPDSTNLPRNGRLPVEETHDVQPFQWLGWARYGAGEEHWLRQDFETEEAVSSCEIFWAPEDDALAEPEWWRLEYLHDGDWREVSIEGEYEFHPGTFTRVEFEPVETQALRIVAQTRENQSSGIFEWRSWLHDEELQRHAVIRDFGVDMMGDPELRTVDSVEVHWHVDPDNPDSQLPAAWEVYALQDDQWEEVDIEGEYEIIEGEPSSVEFEAVEANAVRLVVMTEPGASAGPRDWSVD